MQMDAMKECSTEEAVQKALIMQMFCVVFTQSNQETNKCFYQMKEAGQKTPERIALHSLRLGGVK